MKSLIFGVILVLSTILQLNNAAEDKYSNINPSTIVNNKKIVQKYLDCFYNKGPCNPIASHVKKNIEETLRTECAKCTQQQKVLMKNIVNSFVPKYPEEWKEFLAFYDPKNEHWPKIKKIIGVKY